MRALAFVCSAVLWTGWHYRFRWLLAAFIGLVAVVSRVLMLAGQFWLVLVAQTHSSVRPIGLIYYSSLFYSMDVGEAKGEHGGLHEAAIGLGICAGPGGWCGGVDPIRAQSGQCGRRGR